MRRIWGACFIVASMLLPLVAQADEPARSVSLKQFLESASQGDLSDVALKQQYARLQKQLPNDARVHYAYALANIAKGRYAMALTAANKAADDPNFELPALRAKIWAEIATKKYSAALDDMQVLTKGIVSGRFPGLDDRSQLEAIGYLGRMQGYLSGPLAHVVDPKALVETEHSALASFSADQKAEFEKGRNAILDRFAQLQKSELDLREGLRAEAEKIQTHVQQDLEHRRNAINEGETKIVDDTAKIERQTTTELAKLRPDYARVLRAKAQLDAQALPLMAQRAILEHNIITLQNADRKLYQNNQAAETDRWNQIASYQGSLQIVNMQIAALNIQANFLQGQHLTLEGRRQAVVVRHQLESERLADKTDEIANDAAKLTKLERQANRKVPQTAPQLRTVTQQKASLKAYYEFPIKAEFDRLLDSLK